MIDHHKRAERLRSFMDELSAVREYALSDHGIELDGEIPKVPHRFAQSEWDGSETYINFFDTVEEANAGAGDLGGEYPWVPGAMVDLDTGMHYEPFVTVRFKPLRWVVKVSGPRNDVTDVRFPTKRMAAGWVRIQKDNNDLTVLEGPVDTLKT